MEIKFSKKIIKPLNKWLAQNGFNTECVFEKDGVFQYDPNDNIIIIPGTHIDEPDSLFMKCLRGLGLISDFDTITLSFLHELGHAQTLDLFTDKESAKCDDIKREYQFTIDEDSDDFYLEYWKVKDELLANKWAITYADCFTNKAQKVEDIFGKYLKIG